MCLVVPSTNINSESGSFGVVIVNESRSVNLSCSSDGVPIPSITWTLHDRTTSFTQMDTIMEHNMSAGGMIVSILKIVNPQYPIHDGEYQCIGSNTYRGDTRSSTDTIRVHIQGT